MICLCMRRCDFRTYSVTFYFQVRSFNRRLRAISEDQTFNVTTLSMREIETMELKICDILFCIQTLCISLGTSQKIFNAVISRYLLHPVR